AGSCGRPATAERGRRGEANRRFRPVVSLLLCACWSLQVDKPIRSCFVLRLASRGNSGNETRRQPLKEGWTCLSRPRRLPMTAAYLAKLNTEQRRAVEHGCGALDEAPPLLIIAGQAQAKPTHWPTASRTS